MYTICILFSFSIKLQCEQLCDSISTCVSYEWFEDLQKYRQCQLSSSCTSGLIDPTYNVADNFVCDLTVDQCKEACIDSNGQHGNKDRRGNNPKSCISDGVAQWGWLDRPKGCWGAGIDQYWFNTKTDDSTLCQPDQDQRDYSPGNDYDRKILAFVTLNFSGIFFQI